MHFENILKTKLAVIWNYEKIAGGAADTVSARGSARHNK